VAGLGDLDGDGVPEQAVGSTGGQRVEVYSGADGTLLHTWSGSGRFGHVISALGDVDGDGVGEVLVGAPCDPDYCRGRIYVFSGATGTLLAERKGPEITLFGNSVAALGDVDGDGVDDVASVGRGVHVYRGSDLKRILYFGLYTDVDTQHPRWAFNMAEVGDMDGDGRHDFAFTWTPWLGDDVGRLDVVSTAPIGETYCTAVPASNGRVAEVTAIGSSSPAFNMLQLQFSDLPFNGLGESPFLLLNSAAQGFVQGPAGSVGNLCLGGEIGRHVGGVVGIAPTGEAWLTIDLSGLPRPNGGTHAVQVGETWNFQGWFRDRLKTGEKVSNFTPGYSILFH
jgi:hypothetical protein